MRPLPRTRPPGFTLIELLVVVAIIALLVSILLPTLGGARRAAQGSACMSNLSQVVLGLRLYQQDNEGWYPQSWNDVNPYQPGALWSESAWGVSKRDLWFYKLFPRYTANPNVFACPGDPFRAQFDFEATPDGGAPRTDLGKFSCGYGMTYFLRHYSNQPRSDLMNADARTPKRPMNTILLAEVGPDAGIEYTDLYAKGDGDVGLAAPWRDGGRLIWDDGARGWTAPPTWLTSRHGGGINMATAGGSVQRVDTRAALRNGPLGRNPACWGKSNDFDKSPVLRKLCQDKVVHYQFAEQGLWWWTGDTAQFR